MVLTDFEYSSVGVPLPRRKLASQGAPHLSPIESLSTPSEYDGAESNLPAPLAPTSSEEGEENDCDEDCEVGSHFKRQSLNIASTDTASWHRRLRRKTVASSLLSLARKSPQSTRFPIEKSNVGNTGTERHLNRSSTATFGGRSVASGFSAPFTFRFVNRDKAHADTDHMLLKRASAHSSAYSDQSESNSDSSAESELWGTPVDADAIALGLVCVPGASAVADAEGSSSPANSPASPGQLRKTASVGSKRLRSSRRASTVLFRSRGRSFKRKPLLPVLERMAEVHQRAAPAVTPLRPDGDILSQANISLDSSADPLREVRERCLFNLRLLLAKSIQHGCELCRDPEAIGLFVWAWTSQLLCPRCVDVAAEEVPLALKEILLARTAALGGGNGISAGLVKEVDTQTLARIANSLPYRVLRQLDQVNDGTPAQHRAPNGSRDSATIPRKLQSALGMELNDEGAHLGVPSNDESFMRVGSPNDSTTKWSLTRSNSLSSTTQIPGFFHKALHRVVRRSIPKLRALTGGSCDALMVLPHVSGESLAHLPMRPPRGALSSLKADIVSPDRSSLSPNRSSLSPNRSSLSLDRPFLSPDKSLLSLDRPFLSLDRSLLSLERPFLSPDGSLLSPDRPFLSPASSHGGRSLSSPAFSDPPKSAAEAVFLLASAIFVGKLSVTSHHDDERRVRLDDVFACTASQSSRRDGSNACVVLASCKDEHVLTHHSNSMTCHFLVPFHAHWRSIHDWDSETVVRSEPGTAASRLAPTDWQVSASEQASFYTALTGSHVTKENPPRDVGEMPYSVPPAPNFFHPYDSGRATTDQAPRSPVPTRFATHRAAERRPADVAASAVARQQAWDVEKRAYPCEVDEQEDDSVERALTQILLAHPPQSYLQSFQSLRKPSIDVPHEAVAFEVGEDPAQVSERGSTTHSTVSGIVDCYRNGLDDDAVEELEELGEESGRRLPTYNGGVPAAQEEEQQQQVQHIIDLERCGNTEYSDLDG